MDDTQGFSNNVNIGNINGYGKASAEDGLYVSAHRDAALSPQYSMPGILNYLQTEWSKMEMQRSQWDIEKAELQARIAFLQGERAGQEMLKQDLVRRIKMLEYALKQERVKYQQVKGDLNKANSINTTSTVITELGKDEVETGVVEIKPVEESGGGGGAPDPAEKLAMDTQRAVVANAKWRESRQRLRQFLQEVGYTDTILDARQARVKQLMEGVNHPTARLLTSSVTDVMTSSGSVLPSSAQAAGGNKGSLASMPVDSMPEHSTGGRVLLPQGVNGEDKGSLRNAGSLDSAFMEEGAEADALANFEFLSGEDDSLSDIRNDDGGEDEYEDRKGGKSSGSDQQNFLDSMGGDGSSPKAIRFGRKMGQHSSLKAMLASLEEDCRDLSSLEMQRTSDESDPGGQECNSSSANLHSVPVSGTSGGTSPEELEGFTGALGLGDLATLTVANEAEAVGSGGGAGVGGGGGDMLDSSGNADETCIGEVEGEGERKTWTPKYTLRGHFDSIRSVVFHGSERALFTGGEDGTINVWNLNKVAQTKKCVSADVEPIHTLRGHDGPVLGLVIGISEELIDTLYSSGLDGTIRIWKVPDIRYSDLYDAYDSVENGPVLTGHTDAVWSLSMHPSEPTLITSSADGTVRLWQVGTSSPSLLNTLSIPELIGGEENQNVRPTCAQFCPCDVGHCAIGCSDGRIIIVDIEQGKIVSQDLNPTDNSEMNSQVNCLVCHPALPLIMSGHEDSMIRFFDVQEGRTVHSMVAHLEPVTALALDKYGLYLSSASHDSSIRLWNIDTKTCVQENTSHRKKFEESVLCVAFHPKMPLMASAGADALAKVYV